MAVELERFVLPPDENLICPICHNVFYNPQQTKCRHVYCRNCITEWLSEHSTCPTCRDDIGIEDITPVVPLLLNMINKLQVHCVYKKKGCNVTVELEHKDRHETKCSYEPLGCKWAGCSTTLLRKYIEPHERLCEHRNVVCDKDCDFSFPFKDKQQHSCLHELKKAYQGMVQKEKDYKQLVGRLKEQNQELLDRLRDSKASLEQIMSDQERHLSQLYGSEEMFDRNNFGGFDDGRGAIASPDAHFTYQHDNTFLLTEDSDVEEDNSSAGDGTINVEEEEEEDALADTDDEVVLNSSNDDAGEFQEEVSDVAQDEDERDDSVLEDEDEESDELRQSSTEEEEEEDDDVAAEDLDEIVVRATSSTSSQHRKRVIATFGTHTRQKRLRLDQSDISGVSSSEEDD